MNEFVVCVKDICCTLFDDYVLEGYTIRDSYDEMKSIVVRLDRVDFRKCTAESHGVKYYLDGIKRVDNVPDVRPVFVIKEWHMINENNHGKYILVGLVDGEQVSERIESIDFENCVCKTIEAIYGLCGRRKKDE